MSYPYPEQRRGSRSSSGFRWAFPIVGVAMALVGWFWHYPQVTYARGVVVEARPLNPPFVWLIRYDYSVGANRYTGERMMHLSSQNQPFYRVGSFFPVYFVTAHPEQSYGPGRPLVQPLIFAGLFLATGSSAIIYFAWRR